MNWFVCRGKQNPRQCNIGPNKFLRGYSKIVHGCSLIWLKTGWLDAKPFESLAKDALALAAGRSTSSSAWIQHARRGSCLSRGLQGCTVRWSEGRACGFSKASIQLVIFLVAAVWDVSTKKHLAAVSLSEFWGCIQHMEEKVEALKNVKYVLVLLQILSPCISFLNLQPVLRGGLHRMVRMPSFFWTFAESDARFENCLRFGIQCWKLMPTQLGMHWPWKYWAISIQSPIHLHGFEAYRKQYLYGILLQRFLILDEHDSFLNDCEFDHYSSIHPPLQRQEMWLVQQKSFNQCGGARFENFLLAALVPTEKVVGRQMQTIM